MITSALNWIRNIKLCIFGIHKKVIVHKSKSHKLIKCDHCGNRWSKKINISDKKLKNGIRK